MEGKRVLCSLSPSPLFKIQGSCCPGVSGALTIDSTELHAGTVKRGPITWQDYSLQIQAKILKNSTLESGALICRCVSPEPPNPLSAPFFFLCRCCATWDAMGEFTHLPVDAMGHSLFISIVYAYWARVFILNHIISSFPSMCQQKERFQFRRL